MKNHQPNSNLHAFLGMKPKRYTVEIDGKKIECVDVVKSSGVGAGTVIALIKPFKQFDLWAYYDHLQFPAARWLGISIFLQLATAEPSAWEMVNAWQRAKELKDAGKMKEMAALIDKASAAATFTEYENKWLNLASGFLFSEEETHTEYEAKAGKKKTDLFQMQPPGVRQAVINWAIAYYNAIMREAQARFPKQFKGANSEKKPFLEFLAEAQKNEENMAVALLQMTGKDATKLDKLTHIPLSKYLELSGNWATLVERETEAVKGKK